ncbi:MAG: polyhydroxyalkanoate synthesis repressor PhaR [Pseudomonadota bacterium]
MLRSDVHSKLIAKQQQRRLHSVAGVLQRHIHGEKRCSMSGPRTIKKYPNRRLYDTEESRYITLTDIRRLVMDKVEFVVIDKKSQKDITHGILLQVISEQEQAGEPIFSTEFLSQIIRSYGGNMHHFIGNYMEQSLKLFMNQQQQFRDRVKTVVGVDPVGMVANVAMKNFSRWKSAQEEIFRTLSGVAGTAAARTTEEREDDEPTHRS